MPTRGPTELFTTRQQVRVFLGEVRNEQAVKHNRHEPGNHPSGKQLGDLNFGHDPVEHEDDRGRNHDPQSTTRRDHAR